MTNMTTHQLAELLLGIARAQQAIIEAMENSKAGFKSTHFRPMLETASRIRSNRPETLADYPPRLLLQMMGRNAPLVEAVEKELDELLNAKPAEGGGAGGDTGSLDMTAPGG